MPVVRKVVGGVPYWRIRLQKKPERFMMWKGTESIEKMREYSELARRFIKGDERALDEIRERRDLYLRLVELGYIKETRPMSIREASDTLGISYEYLCTLSLGAAYPVPHEIINGRRYFERASLIQWAMKFLQEASHNKEAWECVPGLFHSTFGEYLCSSQK